MANELTAFLNDQQLLETTLSLFHTLKTSVDTMREVKAYNLPEGAPKIRKEEDTKLFAGFFSKIAKLIANLTYLQKAHVEKTFLHGN